MRTRVLDLLYKQKAAVEDLIQSLEDYQRNYGPRGADYDKLPRNGSGR